MNKDFEGMELVKEDADGDALAAAATATSAAETAAATSAAATAVPPARSGVTSKGRVAIMTDGEEVGKKITTDAVKEAKEEEQEEDEEERIESREKGGENPSSETNSHLDIDSCMAEIRARDSLGDGANENYNNNNRKRKRGDHRSIAPPGWHRAKFSPTSSQATTTTTTAATTMADPYGWDDHDTFHDVVGRNEEILNLEKAHHLHYLLEYRVKQCPLFLLGKCQSHKPFTCFHWHFLNQRRRRPARRPSGSYNYSPYVYCTKYDEKTGICEDGDACTYLHHNLGDTECIYHLRYFKTTPCIHESSEFGSCRRYGRHCAFGHGEDDFRAPIFDVPSAAMAPHLTYAIPSTAASDYLAGFMGEGFLSSGEFRGGKGGSRGEEKRDGKAEMDGGAERMDSAVVGLSRDVWSASKSAGIIDLIAESVGNDTTGTTVGDRGISTSKAVSDFLSSLETLLKQPLPYPSPAASGGRTPMIDDEAGKRDNDLVKGAENVTDAAGCDDSGGSGGGRLYRRNILNGEDGEIDASGTEDGGAEALVDASLLTDGVSCCDRGGSGGGRGGDGGSGGGHGSGSGGSGVGKELPGKENESFQAWEQALNQARAACAAWREEAEGAKAVVEEKEKEMEEEKRKKEMALITCERLSAKMAVLASFGEDAETSNSKSNSPDSTLSPTSSRNLSKEFWRFLCQMDEDSLKVDDLSLDKLVEMKRILGRCLDNVDGVMKMQNAALKKIWDGEN